MRVNSKRIILYSCDGILTCVSGYVAICLRFSEFPLPSDWTHLYFMILAPLVACRLIALTFTGVYRIAPRHTGIRDLQVIGLSTLISSVAFTGYIGLARHNEFPRSIIVIEWFLNLFLIAGSRATYRILFDERPSSLRFFAPEEEKTARRILIVGAGSRGASVAREIRRRSGEGLVLVGFLDDNPEKLHRLVHRAAVLGSTQLIRKVVKDLAIDDVIIAMPSATGAQLRDIIVRCEDLPIRLRISPGFAELNSEGQLPALREVSVEDLLRREPVTVNMKEISSYLSGERVLVTGAGGSIGSELVRQIIAAQPAEIYLLGHGEWSIFEIEQEVRRRSHIPVVPLIVDVRDYNRMRQMFERYRPTVVFHAAAHKHVPLMEAHPVEAVTTNILGTRNVVQLSDEFDVRRFVMISTDKAVNPTSVMGASKRIAEELVRLQSRHSRGEFVAVRFGNVLGSRGSVVPSLHKQIASGGPVTVTHPDVFRYFMTIPEAAQLVLQAGSLGGRGTLYLLDMGEPVRIIDLARDLIRLCGLVPDKDIQIKIIGLRPGEKLHEELLTAEEGASVTRHERIYSAPPSYPTATDFDRKVNLLVAAAQEGDSEAVIQLLQAVEPTYRPNNPLSSAVSETAVQEPARMQVGRSVQDDNPSVAHS